MDNDTNNPRNIRINFFKDEEIKGGKEQRGVNQHFCFEHQEKDIKVEEE